MYVIMGRVNRHLLAAHKRESDDNDYSTILVVYYLFGGGENAGFFSL